MPHIPLPSQFVGIVSLFAFSPETSMPLNELAEILLRSPNSLEQWERELIGTYISYLNECKFCTNTHAAMVKYLNRKDENLVDAVKRDYMTAPISEKLKSLLTIAGKVQSDAKKVLPQDIENARKHGATDKEIHDSVLIAAAFCMYNKYVDGLATTEWESPEIYDQRAKSTAERSYFHQEY